MIPTPGFEHLKYQPLSSLVQCNAGERVLLRFANLGFKQAAMTLAGIKMHVVGRDATPLVGRDGTDNSLQTNIISLNAGESADAIFTAPAYQGPGAYDSYLLYNRSYSNSHFEMVATRECVSGSISAHTGDGCSASPRSQCPGRSGRWYCLYHWRCGNTHL